MKSYLFFIFLGVLFFIFFIYTEEISNFHSKSYWPIVAKVEDDVTIAVDIEGNTYPLVIDLGASIYMSLQEKILEGIQGKLAQEVSRTFYDFQGNEYDSSSEFLISQLNLQGLKIENIKTKIENLEFLQNCEIVPADFLNKNPLSSINGRIGALFFSSYACLFKLSNSMIYLARDILDFKNLISFTDYVEVPMEIISGGMIVVSIELDIGMKKFMLDTGSSGAIFRESLVGDKKLLLKKNLAKQIDSDRWLFRSKKFNVGGIDFGNQNFWLFELGAGWDDVDGFIGVDFFKKHDICFDFTNHKIYIQKPKKSFWEKIYTLFKKQHDNSD